MITCHTNKNATKINCWFVSDNKVYIFSSLYNVFFIFYIKEDHQFASMDTEEQLNVTV